jgi:antitoxin component of MazEF toxin-antitoxin module
MIIKKLTRQGNSAALVIDKQLLDLLDFNQDTELKITVNGRQLIVEPLSDSERAARFNEISKRDLKKNKELYRRLAK